MSDDRTYLREIMQFSGSSMTSTNKVYSASSCADSVLLSTEVSAYSFVINQTLDAHQMKGLTLTTATWTITPASTAGVQYLSTGTCTLCRLNWSAGVTKNIYAEPTMASEEQVGTVFSGQFKVSGSTFTDGDNRVFTRE